MSVVFSLYDALVSINVPDEKARVVINALEREMMDKLATKADLQYNLTTRLGLMMGGRIAVATALVTLGQYLR